MTEITTQESMGPAFGQEAGDPQAQPLPTGALDVLGTLFDMPTAVDERGLPVGEPVALPGWHVNSPWPITGWDAWRVNPSQPRRVFGGEQTVHYTFADEAAFLKALDGADLSEPAPAPDPKMVGIEFAGVRCSATQTDQNGLVAVITAYQLAKANFQPTVFQFANGNSLNITKDNIMQFVTVWMPFRQSFFKAA